MRQPRYTRSRWQKDRDDEMKRYREANPVTIVNVAWVGTGYGRFPTVEAAVEWITTRGAQVTEIRGQTVYFFEARTC